MSGVELFTIPALTAGGTATAVSLADAAVVTGALASVGGSLYQGAAANNAAETQAELYRRQAERETQIGAINAERKRQEGERLAGSQRALMAAQGRDASTGSALLVQEDLAQETEFNAKLIENNAEAQTSNLTAQKIMSLAAGKAEQTSSYFRAGSTLLTTGGRLFGGSKYGWGTT